MPGGADPPLEQQHPYQLVLAPGARPALSQGLPATVAFAAWEFISGPLLDRPKIVGVPLRKPFEGLWRARRGEYRVRYRIDQDASKVIVLQISYRRDAYRS